MSDSNEPLSDKSQKRRGNASGASSPSVTHKTGGKTTSNNSNRVKDQDSRKGHTKKDVKVRRKTQMPSKKRSGGNGFVLSKEDIYYLKTHTRYDEKEIK